jgi:uncharacterized membrane protein
MPSFTQAGLLDTIFAFAFAATLIAVMWGIVMYFAEIGSEEARKEFKGIIIGSITWLLVLMCLYAIVGWIQHSLGF